jgi:hypothetical protein
MRLDGLFRGFIKGSGNHREKNLSTKQSLSKENPRVSYTNEYKKWCAGAQEKKGKRTQTFVRLKSDALHSQNNVGYVDLPNTDRS